MLKGIDISHFQAPSAVPWADLAAADAFCIVRTTYGTKRDEKAAEHIRRARAAGVRVGVYHFFRPTQPLNDQLEAFKSACDGAGYGESSDIVPALDFEDDTTARPILPEHAPLAHALITSLADHFGVKPLLYITQRDWGRVGSPAWALDFPLWVAHYSAASRMQPATPAGKPWAIWQHRVGPLNLQGPHGYYDPALYDQNVANYLPLLDGTKFGPHPAPPEDKLPEPPDNHGTEMLMAAGLLERGLARLDDDRASNLLGDPDDEITVTHNLDKGIA